MSVLKTTFIQHPSAESPAIELDATDGVVFSAASFDASVITSGTVDANRLPPIPDNAFDSVTTITATNASWSVPALGSPIVKVTVIGGGGGGGGAMVNETNGAAGGSSTFSVTGQSLTATGGVGGNPGTRNLVGLSGSDGRSAGNGGQGGGGAVSSDNRPSGQSGNGGQISVGYFDLTGITTANVTIGAGGAGGTSSAGNGGPGGRGEVIVEYKAA